jgi:hypothetical protein
VRYNALIIALLRSLVPLDEREAVLDGDAVPAVHHVECSLSPAESTSNLLVWSNEKRVAHVRLIAKQLLPTVQRRSVLPEEANIVRDTYVWPAVPHEVAAVIAHSLHLTTNKTRQMSEKCARVRT